jgi:alpha-1,3-glucan synthase
MPSSSGGVLESSSTAHLLSRLIETIKMALKSRDEVRAIPRAQSAIQHFPVVDRRKRMEDLYKLDVNISLGPDA